MAVNALSAQWPIPGSCRSHSLVAPSLLKWRNFYGSQRSAFLVSHSQMRESESRLKDTSDVQDAEPPLSKNALKRQLKRKRWEESKPERRAHKKAKLKEKQESLKQSGQKLRKRPAKVVGQEKSGVRVVIDCAFDDYMIEKV